MQHNSASFASKDDCAVKHSMSTPPQAPGALRKLWFRWKALRLPWRRQFLIGNDLAGNSFWEFRDQLNAGKWRRIVKYSNVPHYADVKISRMFHVPPSASYYAQRRLTRPSCDEQHNGTNGSVTPGIQPRPSKNNNTKYHVKRA